MDQTAPEISSELERSNLDIKWSDAKHVVASGFAMGSADVVPGVSGGTMAVACGIYEQLLDAIASINGASLRALLRFQVKEVLRLVHVKFLVSLFAGIFAAVVVMVKIVGLPKLLISAPTLVYAAFFGLVFASVFILGKKIAWSVVRWATLFGGTAFGFAVVNLVPMDMPGSPLFMFGYGVIAISAMLLPGISGSFLLLIMGQYERVIGALERLIHFDLSALAVVAPFALGCLVGLGAFARVVAWLLHRHHDTVVAGLCGLLLGSLWRIWPYQQVITREVRGKVKVIEATPFFPESFDFSVLGLIVAGFVAVFVIEFLADLRHGPSERS